MGKQRGQVKWVILGDAGSKFFHAHATIRFMTNLITHLTGLIKTTNNVKPHCWLG